MGRWWGVEFEFEIEVEIEVEIWAKAGLVRFK